VLKHRPQSEPPARGGGSDELEAVAGVSANRVQLVTTSNAQEAQSSLAREVLDACAPGRGTFI
jgi:hypothetical protein